MPSPAGIARLVRTQPAPSRTGPLLKRGGSGNGETVTGTVPNHPPSSTDTVHGHHIPQINGSEGGFWGLLWGLLVVAVIAGLAAWYILLRRRRLRQSLPPPNPFSCLARRRRDRSGAPPGRAKGSGASAAAKRGWIEGSSRAWDTLGDDEDAGYGMGGLQSARRVERAYGQGGLESPGLEDRRRERFDSADSAAATTSAAEDERFGSAYPPSSSPSASRHPYGASREGQSLYASAAADSTLSFSSSPPRAPYATLAPSGSTSTVRLVPPQPAPEHNPFDDGASVRSDAGSDDGQQQGERTARPAHGREDSSGSSRFVEGD